MKELKNIAKEIEDKFNEDKEEMFLEVTIKDEEEDVWIIFNRDYDEFDITLPVKEARQYLEGILFGMEL